MSIQFFFDPKSVAVIGASEKPLKAGHVILKNLKEFGYQGAVYPVHPRLRSVLGYTSYPSLSSLPSGAQTAVIALPREKVPAAIREAIQCGVRGAIVVTAGFSDAGDDVGRSLEKEILSALNGSDLRLMGPNSIGTINPSSGFITSITSHRRLLPGSVGLFGQSGMFGSGFANQVRSEQRFQISHVACLGNKLDVDEVDLLRFFAADDATGVVGVYFEGLKDGRRFMEAVREVSKRKPVVVLKSGRTAMGQRAAASHTGALSGNDAIVHGVLQQLRQNRAEDFEDFFDMLEGFAHCPKAQGNRVAVVSITGVGCVLCADAASSFGLAWADFSDKSLDQMRQAFPSWAPVRNPVDMWSAIERNGVETAYQSLCEIALSDPGVDSLLVIFTLIPECQFDAAALMGGLRERHPNKPVVACFMGGEAELIQSWSLCFRRLHVPVFPSPKRALRVIKALSLQPAQTQLS